MIYVDNLYYKFKYKKLLKGHQFFINMNYWNNIQINTLKIENPAKKKLFIFFLNTKFSVFEKTFSEFLSSPKCVTEIDKIEGMLIECIKEYEAITRQNGVPDIFLDKFNNWHQADIEMTVLLIREIILSQSHADAYSKLIAIMDVLNYAFRKTIIHAENTCNSMNGNLEAALRGTRFDVI